MATTTEFPASIKQLDFIAKLVEERNVVVGVTDVPAFVKAISDQRITKSGASALINKLLATPRNPPPVVENAEPVVEQLRANGYAGSCGRCGKRVFPREGYIERVGGRWVTYHHDGDCPQDHEAKAAELIGDLPDGYFAIPYIGRDADRTDLTFLGVRTTRQGGRYVVHVVGGHGETDDLSLDWVERATAALRAVDLEEAAALYGRELGHCGRCGRTLTNDASRAIGIGPECATKGF